MVSHLLVRKLKCLYASSPPEAVDVDSIGPLADKYKESAGRPIRPILSPLSKLTCRLIPSMKPSWKVSNIGRVLNGGNLSMLGNFGCFSVLLNCNWAEIYVTTWPRNTVSSQLRLLSSNDCSFNVPSKDIQAYKRLKSGRRSDMRLCIFSLSDSSHVQSNARSGPQKAVKSEQELGYSKQKTVRKGILLVAVQIEKYW